jgi:hypothetical protein
LNSKLTLLVCENLEREVRAVQESECWENVEVLVCPALCPAPENYAVTAQKVADATNRHPAQCLVVGCGGMRELAGGVHEGPPQGRVAMASCFELLIGPQLASGWMRDGAFLLTPGWLGRWPEYIRVWGFDQATAREFFSECVSRLVLLDSGVDPDSAQRLVEFASFVDRPAETVPVGLDYFRLHLAHLLLPWELDKQRAAHAFALADAQRRLADYAMSYDLVGSLAGMKSEDQVIEAIFDLFSMLFAPASLVYVPIVDGKAEPARYFPETAPMDPSAVARLAELREEYVWTGSERGFALRMGEPGAVLGVLKVEDVAFPQHIQQYMNLGLSLARVCALALRNARVYEQLQSTVGQLQEALASIKTLSGFIPICASCKKIRDDEGFWTQVESYVSKHTDAVFSHGICPDCLAKYGGDAL